MAAKWGVPYIEFAIAVGFEGSGSFETRKRFFVKIQSTAAVKLGWCKGKA